MDVNITYLCSCRVLNTLGTYLVVIFWQVATWLFVLKWRYHRTLDMGCINPISRSVGLVVPASLGNSK